MPSAYLYSSNVIKFAISILVKTWGRINSPRLIIWKRVSPRLKQPLAYWKGKRTAGLLAPAPATNSLKPRD
jgi:hypothetical protein